MGVGCLLVLNYYGIYCWLDYNGSPLAASLQRTTVEDLLCELGFVIVTIPAVGLPQTSQQPCVTVQWSVGSCDMLLLD